MSAAEPQPTPTPAELVEELKRVVTEGAQPARLERINERLGGLRSLSCVALAAAPPAHDQAQRIVEVIDRVTTRLPDEGNLRPGLRVLLGLQSNYRLAKAPDRRKRAAELLFDPGMSAETFLRRHQEEVLTLLADELLAFEKQYRLRATRQLLDDDAPVFNALAVQWLDQFSYYYRVFAAMSGLRNDLDVYLHRRSDNPDYEPLTSYHTSSLWFFARLEYYVGRFVDERGGIWMFSDQKIEDAIIKAVRLAGWHSPFAEQELSLLKLALVLQYTDPTLVLFHNTLLDSEDGRDVLDKWARFIDSCDCDPNDPASDCEVHLIIRYADTYCSLVDAEWNRIAGWYRQPSPRGAASAADDVRKLFEQFDATRWEQP